MRIFYVAPVRTTRESQAFEIPAVRNKVLGVCEAISAAGGAPFIISSIGGSADCTLLRPVRLRRVERIGAVEIFVRGRAGVRRLASLWSLWIASLLLVRRSDVIVLYNFFPEYFLLALWCRIVGIKCVLDCEDAPRADETDLRGAVARLSFKIIKRLCDPACLVASHELASRVGLKTYLPVYGVSSYFRLSEPREPPFAGSRIVIGFGGAMMRETGLDLFKSAVEMLASRELSDHFHFIVTGHFEKDLFASCQDSVAANPRVSLDLLPYLDRDTFRQVAQSLDVGLCLKLPSTEMGQTTFPSKVIEIAALGTLLCSTPVSDVPRIFDETNAEILSGETPQELADSLIRIAGDRRGSAERAERGRRLVLEQFSARAVGASLIAFLQGKAA